MMTQTLALFVDAYRELNARKLFWVVMGLSGLFVLAFALVGINDKGLTVLWWSVPIPVLNTGVISRSFFYLLVFHVLGLGFWLTWVAMILAIISTASIIPDFVSGGAIELTLSKPIGRKRLFLTKYATGLLFVGLQATLFSLASMLVVGIRGGSWQPGILLAIPLVVLVFSFVYCVSALVGLRTRSPVAAMLMAGLFWFVVFLVNTADGVMLNFKAQYDLASASIQAEHDAARDALEQARGRAEPDEAEVESAESELASVSSRLSDVRADQATWGRWYRGIFLVKSVLPKTGETKDLLARYVLSGSEVERLQDAGEQSGGAPRMRTVHEARISERAVRAEMQRVLDRRSAWWIVGTSLSFEGAVLALAVWIFARRDF